MGFTISNVKPAKAKAAKKAVSAKKAAPAKKAAAVKPSSAAVQEASAAAAVSAPKAPVKRVPPRIVRKAVPAENAGAAAADDNSAAVALALQIARERKRSAQTEDLRRQEQEIKLSRRPTTRTQGKNTVKFPPADLKDFRRRLLEARERALTGVDGLKATGFNESEDHEADGGDGTNQTLRLQALGQMGQINRTIQQIEEALHRIDDGTYGVCTACGQLIRKPRLLNQPFVLTCMECQNEMERNRG